MSKTKGSNKKEKGRSSKACIDNRCAPCSEQVPLVVDQNISFKSSKPRKFTAHTIIYNKTELPAYRIHTFEKFLQAQECEYFIIWAENRGFEECQQTQTKEYAHRENGRIQIGDADLAQQIYCRLLPLLLSSVDGLAPRGCSSNIRFYRYTVGQRFGKHIDESHHDEALH